ncbi:hypothetical protein T12_6888 [Trichinella patagoniensis]|uniref:Uncharacterized protein n=1 Tax=Trichinella patagoniensis TaxID=990121 RepID=A0A0V0ZUY9_9BILA|nr:hypothetical protein T12_6888 [Trichinella patagoniensis]
MKLPSEHIKSDHPIDITLLFISSSYANPFFSSLTDSDYMESSQVIVHPSIGLMDLYSNEKKTEDVVLASYVIEAVVEG